MKPTMQAQVFSVVLLCNMYSLSYAAGEYLFTCPGTVPRQCNEATTIEECKKSYKAIEGATVDQETPNQRKGMMAYECKWEYANNANGGVCTQTTSQCVVYPKQ